MSLLAILPHAMHPPSRFMLEQITWYVTDGHLLVFGLGHLPYEGLMMCIRDMQVWTDRHPVVHQALPFDKYGEDHNTFQAEPGHNDDSAHEDSGTAPRPPLSALA